MPSTVELNLLLILIHVLRVCSNGACTSGCSSGFMDIDLLRRRAEKNLDQRISDYGLNEEFILMSSLPFKCNGKITGFFIGGSTSWNQSNKNQYPEIQLWRNTGDGRYFKQDSQKIALPKGYFSPDGVLQYSLSTPMMYQSGDVLGVYQPSIETSAVRLFYRHSTMYRLSSQPNSTEIDINSMNQILNEEILISPYPESSCTSNFLTLSDLRQKIQDLNINAVQRFTEKQHIIYPNITFVCNGWITKLVVGVYAPNETKVKTTPTSCPEVQIWRRESNSYMKIKSIPLSADQVIQNQSTIEVTIPLFSIRVQEGDILGVYQPSSETSFSIKYQKQDGPINYDITNQNSTVSVVSPMTSYKPSYDYPLVTIEVISDNLLYCVCAPVSFVVLLFIIGTATVAVILSIFINQRRKWRNHLTQHKAAGSFGNEQYLAESSFENDDQQDYETVYDYAQVTKTSESDNNAAVDFIVPLHQNVAYSNSDLTELNSDDSSVEQFEDHSGHPLDEFEGSNVYSYAGVGLRHATYTLDSIRAVTK